MHRHALPQHVGDVRMPQGVELTGLTAAASAVNVLEKASGSSWRS